MRLLVTVVLVFLIGCVSCIREEVGEHIQYIQPGDCLLYTSDAAEQYLTGIL